MSQYFTDKHLKDIKRQATLDCAIGNVKFLHEFLIKDGELPHDIIVRELYGILKDLREIKALEVDTITSNEQ